jgi:hypothetical protein
MICTCADVYTRVDVRDSNSFQSAEEYQEEVRIKEEGEKAKRTATSLEADCDPTDLLNHWIEELDMVKMVKIIEETFFSNLIIFRISRKRTNPGTKHRLNQEDLTMQLKRKIKDVLSSNLTQFKMRKCW